MELKKIKKIVKAELIKNPVTRKSDNLLFLSVCEQMGVDTFQCLDFLIITNALPSFESVRRCRQKLQREFPELKDEKTVERREELESEYRAFARG